METISSLLEQLRPRFRQLAEEAGLGQSEVAVLAKPLTPEEAIGTPGRRDFPIIIGKERILEAVVEEARGHALTDSPREFHGKYRDMAFEYRRPAGKPDRLGRHGRAEPLPGSLLRRLLPPDGRRHRGAGTGTDW